MHHSQGMLGEMPTPNVPPESRHATEIAAADTYRPGQPVWVHRGAWQPGVILEASPRAVLVRYRHHGRALGIDTVLPYQVAHREEPDRLIDDIAP